MLLELQLELMPLTLDLQQLNCQIWLFLSISHKLDQKVELLGDVSWTGWSSIPKIDVVNTNTGSTVQTLETKFRDSFRFAVGANYQYSSNMKLKFGAAYDMTPVKGADTRLVSLPDNDRIWLSTGFQWQKDKSNVFDFGLARVFIKDASIYNDQRASARGLVSGNYKSSAWLLGAQYSHSF